MDPILSIKNRTQKRKNNTKDQIVEKTIQVKKAHYVDGYKIEIEFNDLTVKTVDFGNFLAKHSHPQYDIYKDSELFKQFKIEAGNLVWGENWDLIFPVIQLYRGTIKA